MEYAIVFGAVCTIMDCAWQKIGRGVLLIGFLGGVSVMVWRLWQGACGWNDLLLALLPGIFLRVFGALSGGRLGRGDGDMVLVFGRLLGWELCLAILCMACLLVAVFAGAGLAAGKLEKDSRVPFAPFLLGATVLLWMLSLGGR